MKIKQLSIFLENNAGRLAEVTEVISRAGVDMRALTIADTADFGILRIIVDKVEVASKALIDAGFTVRVTEVLAIAISDEPGSFAKVMGIFKETGVNVEYLYASLAGDAGRAAIICKVEDIDRGVEIARTHGLSAVEVF